MQEKISCVLHKARISAIYRDVPTEKVRIDGQKVEIDE